MSDTPRTDELAAYRYGHIDEKWVSESDARQLEQDLNAANAKLKYLASKGLIVGPMRSSDNPEPYLTYHIIPGSELCDLKTLAEIREAEAKLEIERSKVDKLRQALNRFVDGVDNTVMNTTFGKDVLEETK